MCPVHKNWIKIAKQHADLSCEKFIKKHSNKQKIINGILQLNPSTKELFKFDCSKNKFKILSFYTYNNKGKIIDKVVTPPPSSGFLDIPPNSIIQVVCDFVCEKTDSDVLTKKKVENELENAFSKLKKEFNLLDSTKNYKGVVFNKEFNTVNGILQIKTLNIDSSMSGHKFGLIGNNEFCNIDTFYFIGFAHFINNKFSQLSLESFNQYRFVASYFVKKYGIPDEYNETSIIWKGKNLQMIVTDNSKKKDNNSLLGEATVIISLY